MFFFIDCSYADLSNVYSTHSWSYVTMVITCIRFSLALGFVPFSLVCYSATVLCISAYVLMYRRLCYVPAFAQHTYACLCERSVSCYEWIVHSWLCVIQCSMLMHSMLSSYIFHFFKFRSVQLFLLSHLYHSFVPEVAFQTCPVLCKTKLTEL